MRNVWILAVLAVMGAATPVWGQAVQNGSEAPKTTGPLKMTPEGRRALGEARKAADQVKGLGGEARQEALQRAAGAYEAVVGRYAGDPATCAAANFEAAELWRRYGSLAVAEQAYGRAAELDPRRYAERGLIQVAHMQRRQKQMGKAHQGYLKVAAIDPSSTRAHQARLWIGRTLDALDKPDEAIAAYRQAVGAAGRPRHTIEACNWLAKALVIVGDLEGAESAIGLADKTVQAAVLEGGSGVESLKKALAEMSARRALQRAKDKKSGAHRDARQLEKGRRGSGQS